MPDPEDSPDCPNVDPTPCCRVRLYALVRRGGGGEGGEAQAGLIPTHSYQLFIIHSGTDINSFNKMFIHDAHATTNCSPPARRTQWENDACTPDLLFVGTYGKHDNACPDEMVRRHMHALILGTNPVRRSCRSCRSYLPPSLPPSLPNPTQTYHT